MIEFLFEDNKYAISTNFAILVEVQNKRNVTIPRSVKFEGKFYIVKTIGKSAFDGCDQMISVSIPDSIEYIEDYAFYNCIELTSITLPNSLKSIGKRVFDYNSMPDCWGYSTISNKLKDVNYIGTIESWCNISKGEYWISGHRFYINGEELTQAIIPQSVKKIKKGTFEGCDNLFSIKLHNGITEIEDRAFASCTNLQTISIPDSVQIIGEWTFSNCLNLISCKISNNITKLQDYTFWNCNSLETLKIPQKLKKIGKYTFYCCFNLKKIDFSSHLTDIGPDCFSSCKSLTHLIIPDNVKFIRDRAFANCENLQSVQLPIGITELSGVFINCKKIKSIKLPTGLQTLSRTFSGCEKLAYIDIPNSVTTIGIETFSNCKSLVSIKIPKIVNIGSGAFHSCESLQSITLRASTTRKLLKSNCIGDHAFKHCFNLTHIEIPTNITIIARNVFSDLPISHIEIPASVTEIQEGAFYNCYFLKELVLHSPQVINMSRWMLDGVSDDLIIYVPSKLMFDYRTNVLWKKYSFKAIEKP